MACASHDAATGLVLYIIVNDVYKTRIIFICFAKSIGRVSVARSKHVCPPRTSPSESLALLWYMSTYLHH